jgi:hypothetical protein
MTEKKVCPQSSTRECEVSYDDRAGSSLTRQILAVSNLMDKDQKRLSMGERWKGISKD